MSYACYGYYLSIGGNMIPDEDTFKSLSVEADAYLDYITRGRIKIDDETPEAYKTAVKNAACAVAETMYKQAHDEDATVNSESVGNHSISYGKTAKSTSEREQEKFRKAALYLSRFGLLYRGMR